ncbi:anti-sigma factor [Marinobacter guineae]|uniref:Anti-sigma factor n=1 Tax=Marinobacter guineae TaxID=432303 RepID=A0A2G1VGB2_9GAMM|nr:zf-HC2 domain-containing protein [Marinobacter guineae]PHQ25569.1 anti-sigma factor [Marinobacter guineae]
MSCNEIRVNLPAYIRNELSAADHDRVAQHLAACKECSELLASEYVLSDALQERFVIPEPSPDFQKRVFAAARGNTDTYAGWSHPVLGGAIAAALAVGIGLGFLLQPTGLTEEATSSVASSDVVVEKPEEPVAIPVDRTVRLAFRSGEALENVTLTLELPPHVELASWPGHHQLSWQVSLDAGENVLSLPLKLLFPGAGELVARLDTGDRQKTFRAPVPEYPLLPVEDPES